jgi:hypothetical protein
MNSRKNLMLSLALGCAVFLQQGSQTAAAADDASVNTLTDAEKAAGWQLLFNGRTPSAGTTSGARESGLAGR